MADLPVERTLHHLQTFETSATEVITTAKYTALYEYCDTSESWIKTPTEGNLIVYKKDTGHPYNFTIINRKCKDNLIEPITKLCDAQSRVPYILFRNNDQEIFAIWFADRTQIQPIFDSIQKLITTQVDAEASLMSMLTKAHGDFETKRNDITHDILSATFSKSSPQKLPHATTIKSEISNTNGSQPISVEGLFATAGGSVSTVGQSLPQTNNVVQQLFQGAAAMGGQASVNNNPTSHPVCIPVNPVCPSGSETLPASLPTDSMSLQEVEGKLKDNMTTPIKQQPAKDNNAVFSFNDLISNLPADSQISLHPGSVLYPHTSSVHFNNSNGILPIASLNGNVDTYVNSEQKSGVAPGIQLSESQFLVALRHALTKREFVTQIYKAYEEVVNSS